MRFEDVETIKRETSDGQAIRLSDGIEGDSFSVMSHGQHGSGRFLDFARNDGGAAVRPDSKGSVQRGRWTGPSAPKVIKVLSFDGPLGRRLWWRLRRRFYRPHDG